MLRLSFFIFSVSLVKAVLDVRVCLELLNLD